MDCKDNNNYYYCVCQKIDRLIFVTVDCILFRISRITFLETVCLNSNSKAIFYKSEMNLISSTLPSLSTMKFNKQSFV